MSISYVNILTIAAIAAVIIDLLFQIGKVLGRHSSLDVSPFGVTIRTIAASALIVKFVTLHDVVLTLGQAIMSLTLITYMVLVYRYHRLRRYKHKK